MRPFPVLTLVLVLGLSGCGGSSSDASRSSTSAPVAAVELSGVLRDAPEGSAVVLLAEPAGPDLNSQANAFLDARELGPDGAFELPRPPRATRLLVLAPGRAVQSLPLASQPSPWVLDPPPEATWTVFVRDESGTAEEDALLLVLDAQGAPLPLPPRELVADREGRLVARGLPAGAHQGLFQSGDGERYALVPFRVEEGEALSADVSLRPDDELALRWLEVCGGDAAELARSLRAGGDE